MSEFGLCECGCGQTTPLAKKTDARKGYRKGEHTRYCPGHVQRTQGKSAQVVQSLSISGELDEEHISILELGDDEESAKVIDARARAIEKQTRRSFVELGLLCHTMDRTGWWSKLDDPETGVTFHSWEDWATSALNVARSSAFAAKKVIEATRGTALEDLREMTRGNLQQFARLSSKVQADPKILKKAKTLTETEFVSAVHKAAPGQHLSKAPALILNLESTERENFDEAVEVAKWAYEIEGRNDSISNIVAYFLDGLCEREGYTKQTNRDAFNAARKREAA
jgi:hypothetical protein